MQECACQRVKSLEERLAKAERTIVSLQMRFTADEGQKNATADRLRNLSLLELEIELRTAAGEGKLEMMQECRRRGARAFSDAMDEAARRGRDDVVQLLRGWGAWVRPGILSELERAGRTDLAGLMRHWHDQDAAAQVR